MAEAQKLTVRPRTVLGKKVKALRRQGVLPGVLFGGHADSTPVETDLHAFELSYRRWGNTTLLSLTGLDGGEVPALIHDVSRDPVHGRMLHVDFTRVSLTEKTHADVPLHFVKESPAVRTLGAVLLHALSEVTVEAFPQDMPRAIDVDLSGLLEIDDAIYVRDLVVDATTIQITNDPDDLVVKAVPVKVEEEPKPAAEAVPVEGEVPAEGEAPEGEAAPATPGEATKGAAPAAEGAKGAPQKAPAAGAPKKT
jgi:large subunit ribosomal protein L25